MNHSRSSPWFHGIIRFIFPSKELTCVNQLSFTSYSKNTPVSMSTLCMRKDEQAIHSHIHVPLRMSQCKRQAQKRFNSNSFLECDSFYKLLIPFSPNIQCVIMLENRCYATRSTNPTPPLQRRSNPQAMQQSTPASHPMHILMTCQVIAH